MSQQRWTAAQMPSQQGKTAIVTGASSGLGLETAAALAAAGARVILACRNPARADAALARVQQQASAADARCMTLDLADLASVRAFTAEFLASESRLDLLINNAGVMALPLQRTADGFEMQIGTNHLGHFALTALLIERLTTSGDARVVNVASLAHRWTRGMDLDDLNWERKRYLKWDAYGKSKLANLLFTFELDSRLRQAGLAVRTLAAHPGYAATNLQMVGPQMENSAIGRLAMSLGNNLIGQPAAMGALPTLYAATAPDVAGGDYIGPDGFQQLRGYPTKVGCRRAARHAPTAQRLWTLSESLVGAKLL